MAVAANCVVVVELFKQYKPLQVDAVDDLLGVAIVKVLDEKRRTDPFPSSKGVGHNDSGERCKRTGAIPSWS